MTMNFSIEQNDNRSNNNKSSALSSIDRNFVSMSSTDYALNVIFSQFENAADAKMSHILNLGVVNKDSCFENVMFILSVG